MIARKAARNLSAISLHKMAQVLGALAFAVLVPRSLGPELFGQFSFALALNLLLQMPGDLGGLDIIGRYVPTWSSQPHKGRARISRLTWQLTITRLGIGALATLIMIFLAPALAPWLTPLNGALIGLTAATHMVSWTPFHLSFGLSHMGRWSVETSWRQIVVIPFLLLLQPWGMTGLLVGLVLSELVFAALGYFWIRPYVKPQAFAWPEFQPYLKFGAGFFAANIVLVALFRLSPVLLELLTRDTVAVGYLGLALSVYMMLTSIFSQYVASFVPTLSLLHNQRRFDEAQRWLERLMRYAALIVGAALIAVSLTANSLAPLLFGADFAPVATVAIVLTLALLAQPAVWGGRFAATAFGYPRVVLVSVVVGLIASVGAALLLMPALIAVGGALSLVVGVLAMGVAYLMLGRAWLSAPWQAWLGAYLPLLLLIPLHDADRPLLLSLALTALAIPAYLAVAWLLHVIKTAEMKQIIAAFLPQ